MRRPGAMKDFIAAARPPRRHHDIRGPRRLAFGLAGLVFGGIRGHLGRLAMRSGV